MTDWKRLFDDLFQSYKDKSSIIAKYINILPQNNKKLISKTPNCCSKTD